MPVSKVDDFISSKSGTFAKGELLGAAAVSVGLASPVCVCFFSPPRDTQPVPAVAAAQAHVCVHRVPFMSHLCFAAQALVCLHVVPFISPSASVLFHLLLVRNKTQNRSGGEGMESMVLEDNTEAAVSADANDAESDKIIVQFLTGER